MKPETLTNALDAIEKDHGFAPARLAVTPTTIVDAAALDRLLQSEVGTGWIARQSTVSMITGGIGDAPSEGGVVSAELAISPQATVQLRRASGGWHVTTLREGEGETRLADTVRHVALGGQIAVYRRYWSLPDDGATEVVAWRLLGFEEIGK